MSTINLAKNYRLYTPEELRDYAYQGLLELNGFDMSDVLEYIFQDAEFNIDQRLDEARKEGYDSGFEEGINTGGYFDLDDCK